MRLEKREMEEALKKILELELELGNIQKLDMELEELRGQMQVKLIWILGW
jgi:hypothetical protein